MDNISWNEINILEEIIFVGKEKEIVFLHYHKVIDEYNECLHAVIG
jgi:hypothetical protein